MRLSLQKAAHTAMDRAACRKSGYLAGFWRDVGFHERRLLLVGGAGKGQYTWHPTSLTGEETLIPLQNGDRFQVERLRKKIHQVNRLQKVAGL
jgi:hypothetical protein